MADIPLLRKVVEWVEEQEQLDEDDRSWLQNTWARRYPSETENECGTAFCVAGKVVNDAGFVFLWGYDPKDPDTEEDLVAQGFATYCFNSKTNQIMFIRDAAAELLGIDSYDADQLFAYYNDAADIRRICERIAGEPL